jgi:hypothetical protein
MALQASLAPVDVLVSRVVKRTKLVLIILKDGGCTKT